MWEKNHVCTFICRIALLSQNSTMYSLNLVVNFGFLDFATMMIDFNRFGISIFGLWSNLVISPSFGYQANPTLHH